VQRKQIGLRSWAETTVVRDRQERKQLIFCPITQWTERTRDDIPQLLLKIPVVRNSLSIL